MSDPHRLDRFVVAQDGGTYVQALAELRRGRKTSHWMWFVLPQLAGLGRSDMARRYAISGADEARALLDHPVLGPRFRECVAALLDLDGTTADAVLGPVDAQKLQSSMTLFEAADPEDATYGEVLDLWFAGRRDATTLALLQGHEEGPTDHGSPT